MALELIKSIEGNLVRDFYDRFVKGFTTVRTINNKSSDLDYQEVSELLDLLKFTRDAWKASIMNYETEIENDMIDYYAYQIKANQLRFEYLLKKAKEKGIKANIFHGL